MSTTKVTDALRNVTAVDAAKITTGTVDVARLPSTVLNSNVDADLTPAHQGIANLGLIMATEHDKVAFNLTNSFIDIFQDDTGITTETNVDRNASEYISTFTTSTTVTTPSSASDYTGSTANATIGSGTVTWTGADKSMRSTNSVSGDFEFTGKLTAGDGTGGWLGAFPVSEVGSFNSSHEAGTMTSAMTNSFFLAWTSRAGATNGSNKGGSVQTTFNPNTNDLFKLTRVGSTIKYFIDSGSGYVLYTTLASQTTADMYLCIGGGGTTGVAYTNLSWSAPVETTNATGTLISDAQTVASTSEVSGVFTYTDSTGTNTIGTDLKIYFTANNGTNWTEAASYGTATTFSGSVKQVKLGKTTVTAGTQVALKAVWANQAVTVAGTSPAYVTGDRSSTITVSTNMTLGAGTVPTLVDGAFNTLAADAFYWNNHTPSAGAYIQFAFSTATVCSEAKWYQDAVAPTHGTWQWQGSNTAGGASGYSNIGSTFTLGGGGSTPWPFTTLTELSGNTTAYLYYRLAWQSGAVSIGSWNGEVEFKQGVTTSEVTGKIAHLNGWAVNY